MTMFRAFLILAALCGFATSSAYAEEVTTTTEQKETVTIAPAPQPTAPAAECTVVGRVNLEICGTCAPCANSDVTGEALTQTRSTTEAVLSLSAKLKKAEGSLGSLRALVKKTDTKSDAMKAELDASIKALTVRIAKLEESLQQSCEGFKGDATVVRLCLEILGGRHKVDEKGIDMVGGSVLRKRKTTTVEGATTVEEEFGDTTDTVTGFGTGCRRIVSLRGADSLHAASVLRAEVGCEKNEVVGLAALEQIRIKEADLHQRSGWEEAFIVLGSAAGGAAVGCGVGGIVQPSESRSSEFHASGCGYGALIGAGAGALVGGLVVLVTGD